MDTPMEHILLDIPLTPEAAQWLRDLCAGKYPDKHFTSDPAVAVAAFIEAAAREDLEAASVIAMRQPAA